MKKKLNTIFEIVMGTLAIFAMLLLIYLMFDHFNSGTWSMESAVKKSLDDSEDFCNAKLLSPDKGIAFVGYDCTPINRTTSGI